MILFYGSRTGNQHMVLMEGEALHCRQALRKKIGDEVLVTDGLGQCFRGIITAISKKEVIVQIQEEVVLNPKRPYKIHMGIAPTKNISRFEWFLEKATEFGIDSITPLLCARSERKVIKPDRLQKILISAMKQSLKTTLPVLNPLTIFQDLAKQALENQKYIAHLEEKPALLIDSYSAEKDVLVLIGPEGDFTPQEIEEAVSYGFHSASLGPYRLRTETAGIAAVQQVHYVNMKSKSNQQ